MPLQTFFSLTPLKPYTCTRYDVPDGSPYAEAVIQSYGGLTWHYSPYRLSDQAQNDEIIIGRNAVPTNNQDIFAGVHPQHRNTIRIYFKGTNVSPENQYLLIFQFTQRYSDPSYAQFFLSGEFLDMVQITGVDQHAILLDCPGSNIGLDLWIRQASPNVWSVMGFNGVDCHLL